jgi:hypothetical protein
MVTTSQLGYKSRRFWRRGGVFWFWEDEALLDHGHSLSSFSGSRTRVAVFVPRDARVLPADLHLVATVYFVYVTLWFPGSNCVHWISVSAILRPPVSLSPSLLHSLVQDPGGPAPFDRTRGTTQQRKLFNIL